MKKTVSTKNNNANLSNIHLKKNEVLVICYGKAEVYDRDKGIEFFEDGMRACDGSESQRYMNVWAALKKFKNCNCVNDSGEAWSI
jgi:hypothetical protein